MQKSKKKNSRHNRVYSRLFCIITTILTAICGATIKDYQGLIYFIGYTIMLFFMTELNQQASEDYLESQIRELKGQIDKLKESQKGENNGKH